MMLDGDRQGMALQVACAILATAIAFLAFPTACRGKDKPAPPPAAPSWMELGSHDAAPGEVASLYQSLYLAQCVPYSTSKDPELLRKFQETAEFRYQQECAHLSVYDGPLQGEWDFQAPAGALDRWPSIARHIEFANESTSYKAKITVYCRQSADDCRKYANDTLNIPPPRPLRFAWPGTSEEDKGWKEAVGSESCVPGPAQDEPPEYPRDELANGVTGSVGLLILTNRCGDARDVVIEKSSRNRDLDRAAIKAAQQWRFDIPVGVDPDQHFHYVREPVDFRI
jgi:TonB family protein